MPRKKKEVSTQAELEKDLGIVFELNDAVDLTEIHNAIADAVGEPQAKFSRPEANSPYDEPDSPYDEQPDEFIPDEIREEDDPDGELDAIAFPICECGCSFPTRGGRFIPGHDARLKSALMRRVFNARSDEGLDEQAADEAQGELVLRGWWKFYPSFAKNEAKRQRRAMTAKCNVCGRPLSDEDSIERGVGPVCSGRHKSMEA